MGLFKKQKKKEEIRKKDLESGKLPELPKLPEFPDFEKDRRELSKLPRFPNDSLGEKFSQNTIKEAVTGKKEEYDEVPEADEFVSGEERMMPRHLDKGISPMTFKEAAKRVKEVEPIFIRIDKFEESLQAFEKAKEQIREIEKMLRNIKSLKEEEERELHAWEREVQTTKQQIEKIDRDIFSKVE